MKVAIIIGLLLFGACFLIGWKRGWSWKQIIITILCSWGCILLLWLISAFFKSLGNTLKG